MTWSIVAHDPATGAFAVAVTTCAFAVGASCPFVRAGVGAVSTQSMTNRYLGPAVLDGMARGLSPAAGDRGRAGRRRGARAQAGPCGGPARPHAAFTGANCVEWCGEITSTGVSIAGNMLAGQAVVADTYVAYVAHADLPLPERLLAALDAGQAAGGDKRGRQSAAMLW
jgi:uncharacterized Ntn-hydrolase superfamily protein